MRTSFVLVGLVATAAALPAQELRAPVFHLTPYAGYMVFGNVIDGPLGTRLSNGTGPLYGAQLGVNLTKHVAVIGNIAHSSGKLQVGVPFLGGLDVGNSSALVYDGGLQFGAPLGKLSRLPITPFVQVGAGALRYTVGAGPIETKATNFAWNVGAGADVSLTRNLGLRLMAKDYIGKFDLKEATALPVNAGRSHNWALSGGIKLGF